MLVLHAQFVSLSNVFWVSILCVLWSISIFRNGLLSTPAVSAVIRKREVCFWHYIINYVDGCLFNLFLIFCGFIFFFGQANGGFIMSASHNPGGPDNDWGIKVIGKKSVAYIFPSQQWFRARLVLRLALSSLASVSEPCLVSERAKLARQW